MRLFFEPTPFYEAAHEAALPNESDLVGYFLDEFYPYYMELTNRVKTAYKITTENTRNFYGGTGKIVNTPDTKNYQAIHAEHLKLSDYYGLLLNAARLKYGIWLNDLLPVKKDDKPRTKRKIR